ncbi:hypothetical protein [Burkholderia multivorans]|uniref:hypothetical protein n=1 Tax=Burkholderia multivorans TaxID=87883 RepID=UPI0020B1D8EB|nr:hypothetical protein [Burkholderia multivorans]
MLITDDMLKKAREAAIAYANEHVRKLAEEIIGWQDSGILLNGRLRDLAKMIEIFDAHHSLHMAESFAIRAALDAAANRTTPDREEIIEECAKVCEEHAKTSYLVEAVTCARKIRSLKTTPTAASSSEATDTERLNWLAWTGIAIRNEYASGRWYLQAPYHTKISCVDDFKRFDTFRAAIDAARAGGVS